MKLWGGRFSGKLNPAAWALNASLEVDQRLAEQDVRGSQAWARSLTQAGVLTEEENSQIQRGLEQIAAEFADGSFAFQESDEDIHTAVERRLGERIGPAAGKLHTGRSRNDQVATDLRMWLLDQLPRLEAALIELQAALVRRAEADPEVMLPGYTHLQRAQPILLSHWWLAHFWPCSATGSGWRTWRIEPQCCRWAQPRWPALRTRWTGPRWPRRSALQRRAPTAWTRSRTGTSPPSSPSARR